MKRSRILSLAVGAVTLAWGLASAGQAATRIVHPTLPYYYNTVQDAIDDAGSGDLILVFPGVYAEELSITTSDLTIRGTTPGQKAILNSFGPFQGQQAVLQSRGLAYMQLLSSCPTAVIRVCDTIGAPGVCGAGLAIDVAADDVRLENLTIEQAALAIANNTGDRLHVENVCLRRTVASGIQSSGEDTRVSWLNANAVAPFAGFSLILSGARPHVSHAYFEGSGAVGLFGEDAELHNVASANASFPGLGSFQLSGPGSAHGMGLACTNTGTCLTIAGGVGARIEKVVATKLHGVSGLSAIYSVGSEAHVAHVTIEDADSALLDAGSMNHYEDLTIRRSGGGLGGAGAVQIFGLESTISDSLITHSYREALHLGGSASTASRITSKFNNGAGVFVTGPDVTLDRSIVTDNLSAGIVNVGTDSNFTGNVAVRNSVEDACNEGTVATDSGNTTPVGDFSTPCLTY